MDTFILLNHLVYRWLVVLLKLLSIDDLLGRLVLYLNIIELKFKLLLFLVHIAESSSLCSCLFLSLACNKARSIVARVSVSLLTY